MPLQADNDEIRGLGFVALKAGYLEEAIDNLLFMLSSVEAYPEEEQRWWVSKKISKAKRLVKTLTFDGKDDLLHDLGACRNLFEWRNEVVHGRIYGNFDRSATLKSGRPNVPDRRIDAAELYALANNLEEAWSALERPMIFAIPRALQR